MSLDPSLQMQGNFVKRHICLADKSSQARKISKYAKASVKVKKIIETYNSSEQKSGNQYSPLVCSKCTLICQSEILDVQGLNYLYEVAVDERSYLPKRQQVNS